MILYKKKLIRKKKNREENPSIRVYEFEKGNKS